MNENGLYLVQEYSFDNPLCSEADSVLNSSFKGCQNKYFWKFKYEFIFDIKFENGANNEMINFIVRDRKHGFVRSKQQIESCLRNWFYNFTYKQSTNKNLLTSTIYKHKLLSKVSNTIVS